MSIPKLIKAGQNYEKRCFDLQLEPLQWDVKQSQITTARIILKSPVGKEIAVISKRSLEVVRFRAKNKVKETVDINNPKNPTDEK